MYCEVIRQVIGFHILGWGWGEQEETVDISVVWPKTRVAPCRREANTLRLLVAVDSEENSSPYLAWHITQHLEVAQ